MVAADGAETDAVEVQTQSLRRAARDTTISNTTLALLLKSGVSDGAAMTYLALEFYAWDDGAATASQDTLAAFRGCKPRAIRNHLTELEDAGFVEVKRRGRCQSNLIVLPDRTEEEHLAFLQEHRPRTYAKVAGGTDTVSGTDLPVKTGTDLPPTRPQLTTPQSNTTNQPEEEFLHVEELTHPAPPPEENTRLVGDECELVNVLTTAGVSETGACKVVAEIQPTLDEVQRSVAGCRAGGWGPGAVVQALRDRRYRDDACSVASREQEEETEAPEAQRMRREAADVWLDDRLRAVVRQKVGRDPTCDLQSAYS